MDCFNIQEQLINFLIYNLKQIYFQTIQTLNLHKVDQVQYLQVVETNHFLG